MAKGIFRSGGALIPFELSSWGHDWLLGVCRTYESVGLMGVYCKFPRLVINHGYFRQKAQLFSPKRHDFCLKQGRSRRSPTRSGFVSSQQRLFLRMRCRIAILSALRVSQLARYASSLVFAWLEDFKRSYTNLLAQMV